MLKIFGFSTIALLFEVLRSPEMPKILSLLFVFILIIAQPSCTTLQLKGRVNSVDSLEISLPKNEFDFELVKGYQQIKEDHYYFESSNWLNKDKKIDLYITYYYLLGDYVFVNEPPIEDLVKETFEDRVISIGDKKTISKSVNEAFSKNKDISIVPFALSDANCHYFRRFLNFAGDGYDVITGAQDKINSVQGDADLSGYICNYGKSDKSDEKIESFLNNIKAGAVFLKSHIQELKKQNTDANS